MKFKLSYEIEDHGWADATIKSNDKIHYISNISYLSDAFSDLSEAVLKLVKGSHEAQCTLEHEPGRSKLRFLRRNVDVEIHVYKFKHEMEDQPWSKGELVYEASTDLKSLKSEYIKIAEKLLTELGEVGYCEAWGYTFPMSYYNEIKRS